MDRLPEVVTGPAPSLADVVAYAARAEWTIRTSGWQRTAAKTYTYLIAIPVICAARTVAWAVERPAKLGFLVLLLLVTGTAAAQIPLLGMIVPDLVDITSWF
uniref:hypothetical protein n=1 Tax=Saccharothrix espanaensis TaxID=103731 RepID=UPI003F496300